LLRSAGIEFTEHEYSHDPNSTSFGLEAAEKLGVDPNRVFKTLIANVDEASMHTGNAYSDQLVTMAKQEGAEVIVMCNNIEAQISEMEDPDDKALFMEEYQMKEPALNRLIQTAYKLLKLETYFTAGVQEVRAWTIGSGWKAPQAASVIHTDFEKGFIKAEVIAFDDYIKFKSEAACRDNGKLRIEGKEYIVKDGDVMHFRFNV
jgi:ribosome-binding ATPase YchF (GTP1/OBG family)